jgi:hypothetical protein
MFGFGKKRRRVRNDTFGPSRMRNAAIAGIGMLAWKWWRNRQQSGSSAHHGDQPYSGSPARPADSM